MRFFRNFFRPPNGQDTTHLTDGEIRLVLRQYQWGSEYVGRLPCYFFSIVPEGGMRAELGRCDLRMGMHDEIYFAGHIGYRIYRQYRGHHYAEKASRLLLHFANELGMEEVIIPPHPGTLCSLGLLLADTKFDLSRTCVLDGVRESLEEINRLFDSMTQQGMELLDKEGVPQDRRQFEYAIDMRYHRQNFEISIPVPAGVLTEELLEQVLEDFHREHKRSYGYSKPEALVQCVSYRVCAIGIIDKPDLKPEPLQPEAPLPQPIAHRSVLFQGAQHRVETPIYLREALVPGQQVPGPCILEQMDTTIVVPEDWTIYVDGYHNLIVHHKEVK